MSDIYQDPREFKYIVLSSGEVILLTPTLNHNDVAQDLAKGGLGPHPSPEPVPVGAGACRIYWQDDAWLASCHGESITLHVKSQGLSDSHHIQRALANPMNYKVFRSDRPVLFSGSLSPKAVGSENASLETQGTCMVSYDKPQERVQVDTPFLYETELLERMFNESRF